MAFKEAIYATGGEDGVFNTLVESGTIMPTAEGQIDEDYEVFCVSTIILFVIAGILTYYSSYTIKRSEILLCEQMRKLEKEIEENKTKVEQDQKKLNNETNIKQL